ncbi:ABC transporter permease, partial [Piscirickettsia salmonis]|uniref:ABC transporter permease n=1 Tax=Piscirickettsia salmonis TaxID=1238 RepID=UPI001180D49A
AFTLAFVYLAQYSRLARASVMDALAADYIRTARAKGLPERTVLYRHALRNGVLPVVTMLGLQFGNVLAGAVLTEQVFTIPGFGKLVVDAVFTRDYAVVQGVVLCVAVGFILMNLLADILYILVNPRLRHA